MKEVNTYPIGTKVWYFNPTLHGELDVKESIVIGSYLHKSRGELYYTLLNDAVEGYAVRLTKKGAEEQRDKYEEIRKELLAQEEKHQERMKKLWEADRYEEYSIDQLPTEGDLNGDEIASTEPANE